MARRRLTPLNPDPAADVPHAERLFAAASVPAPGLGGFAGPAPIARVAAEAASAAAVDALAEELRLARETGRMVVDLPLDAIAADHLTRDRLPAEDDEMAALRESLRLHGQRVPIEVTPLAPAGPDRAGALPYGLISGWRRLAALKALRAEAGGDGFATVQALVRRPEGAAEAYVAMVEENELRVGLSHYERARVAALAAERGVFADEETAIRTLFAAASRPKRSRIRAFLDLYHALDAALRFPARLPERLGLRLVEAVRAGQGPRIAAALAAVDAADPEAERAALEAALARPARSAPAPVALRAGVTLSARLGRGRLVLTLEGDGVDPALVAEVEAALATLRR
ncbi:ParB N-terminal domain-containing protein [Amaricoccus sp.]|uniref:ParB/RepB/Spo0J family partition protein n=1 Tax=Amaricoccus sp. TaxID=1872485 RepID=UPI001B7794F2|nr:ParB N-terminal domain-containing protein [Amaricoccus sp.]MBP7003120.1 ParB N-terminal domain-containing protein [Amaricoccus sp.]